MNYSIWEALIAWGIVAVLITVWDAIAMMAQRRR
jgi:hypothetical protein